MPSVLMDLATLSSVHTISLCLQTSRLGCILNYWIGHANEKLAGLSEKVDGLKLALSRAGVHNNSDSPSARSDTSTQPFGTPKSVQAGTPRTDVMASVKF